ncbi:hypothetical protein J6590_007492, partial [Homalodisca vitripennis]
MRPCGGILDKPLSRHKDGTIVRRPIYIPLPSPSQAWYDGLRPISVWNALVYGST